jgi:hypothetical protein
MTIVRALSVDEVHNLMLTPGTLASDMMAWGWKETDK